MSITKDDCQGVLLLNNQDNTKYTLADNAQSVWINLGHASVYLQSLSDGSVNVEIMPKGNYGAPVVRAFAGVQDLKRKELS